MSQLHRASGVAASNAVLRTKRAHAGDSPRCGEPSALAVEAPSEGHGAEAPRKSKLRSSGSRQTYASESKPVSACMPFTRENRVHGVTLPAKKGHSEMTSNASKYKCGSIAGRAVGAASCASTEHP